MLCMNLEDIMLSIKGQTQKTTCYMIHSHEMFRIGKSIEAERVAVARVEGGEKELPVGVVSFWVTSVFWNCIVVRVAQL